MNTNRQKISKILYHLDPMKTGCVENSMIDEYYFEADEIYESVVKGVSLPTSILVTFEDSFWVGCIPDDIVSIISDSIGKINN